MRSWGPRLWILSILVLVSILGALGYVIFCWYEVELLWLFFAILGIEVLLFVGVTCCLKQTRYLHFHHYTIAMCAIAILGI